MDNFTGRIAVVTGGGTGMGRALVRQLVAEGCQVSMCDVVAETMAETSSLCEQDNPHRVKVSSHLCDVSIEEQVIDFRDAVAAEHETDHIHLLFNNAGIGGGGSFVGDERSEWEKTFSVCWGGVYLCTRAFLPMLIAADCARIVNTSSVNGFWASLGPSVPHTAYSAAKFAVKGFSEALITDLRVHAPHVEVSVVMPGHIGTDIAINSGKVLGNSPPLEMNADEVARTRQRMMQRGLPVDELSDDEIRAAAHQRGIDFKESAPLDADSAATIILSGVREGRWRVLVGDDAHRMDERVRQSPESAYEPEFIESVMEQGHFEALIDPSANKVRA